MIYLFDLDIDGPNLFFEIVNMGLHNSGILFDGIIMHHVFHFTELFSELLDVKFGHGDFVLMAMLFDAGKRGTDEGYFTCRILAFKNIDLIMFRAPNFSGNTPMLIGFLLSRLHLGYHNL